MDIYIAVLQILVLANIALIFLVIVITLGRFDHRCILRQRVQFSISIYQVGTHYQAILQYKFVSPYNLFYLTGGDS